MCLFNTVSVNPVFVCAPDQVAFSTLPLLVLRLLYDGSAEVCAGGAGDGPDRDSLPLRRQGLPAAGIVQQQHAGQTDRQTDRARLSRAVDTVGKHYDDTLRLLYNNVVTTQCVYN